MIPRASVEEHAAHVLELLAPLRAREAETVALDAALGRTTAAAVVSPLALPPFRNSQMDGFAARAADLPGTLPVVGEIAAAPGTPTPLTPGTAVRIMTGAPVPDGADVVVPVEEARVEEARVEEARSGAADEGETVVLPPAPAGRFVREAGSDLAAGSELLPAGILLASRHLAALAAAGLTQVAVRTRPRVAIVSTGSELAEPGEPLGPGRIPDANGVALAAATTAAGGKVVARARVADDPAELAARLDEARAAGAELIITSGGISMGDHEVVRELLEPLGARVGTVAMQPGGPQATGAWQGTPVVCFPGNPVSSQLSFELFVAPTLREIAGLPPAARGRAPLATAVDSPSGRRQYLRGRLRPDGAVEPVGGPGSHLVAALAAADHLLVVPEDATALPAGAEVEVIGL